MTKEKFRQQIVRAALRYSYHQSIIRIRNMAPQIYHPVHTRASERYLKFLVAFIDKHAGQIK